MLIEKKTFNWKNVGIPDVSDRIPANKKPHIRSALKLWTKKRATFSRNPFLHLPSNYLQQELLSVPQLSFLPLQQEHPQLHLHPHLPLIRYLINAAMDRTKAKFIRMHIAIACIGIVPLKTSFMILS